GSRKIGGKGIDGVNIRPKFIEPEGVESIRRNYGDDARSEVILDNNGNVWLGSNTRSADFPVTPNAFQQSLGGKQDGVIIKASPDLSTILMTSFLGGSENDAAFVLALNPSDNTLYVGGNTESRNLPGSTAGVLFPSFQSGATDGFVSIISNDGGSILKTTYIGTNGIDMLYGIQFDRFAFPYIMGTTTGNWPVLNARYSETGGKQFIAKLRPDLSAYEYSTVFGTNSALPNLSPVAFLVDRCENVYVSGWGGEVNTTSEYPNSGTTGLTVTSDAIQRSTDNSDFYFFVLEKNANSQIYGSFFGQSGGTGEHVDGGTSRFDRNGVIYQAICANCRADARFPTTPGVWSPSNGSDNCNVAAVKIAFNFAGVTGSVQSSIKGVVQDTVGCVPLTVDFTDTIALGKQYIWNFGDGTPDVTTTTPSLSHTFNSIGSYRVRLVSVDSLKCNIADTAYTNIRVRTFEAIPDFTARKLPPCEAFNFEFTNTSRVSPAARAFSDTSFRWDFGDNTPPVIAGLNTVAHTFPGPGEYLVRLEVTDTNFCNAPVDTAQMLRIATNVKAAFQSPAIGCAPYTAIFSNTSAGGQQFLWNFGDNSSSTETNPSHIFTVPGIYRVTLTAIDSATCNIIDTTSATIDVRNKPVASFIFTPNPPQENTPVDFFNNSTGAIRYLWKFGDDDSLLTATQDPVRHIYNQTDTFTACLIAMNDFGCPDTLCRDVQARIVPVLDVPNAFTPNGDGVNDRIFVRGFGIAKMRWKIYNRWGALVFETTDRLQGWDGTYKGGMQPKEVYHYVLDVEYSDNSKFQKKGDITLLR
ncbi:MAG TPA: PKD domain-containing protein, partial [Segetibacter sp.]